MHCTAETETARKKLRLRKTSSKSKALRISDVYILKNKAYLRTALLLSYAPLNLDVGTIFGRQTQHRHSNFFCNCHAVSFVSTRACCKTDTFQTVYSAPPGDSSVSSKQHPDTCDISGSNSTDITLLGYF